MIAPDNCDDLCPFHSNVDCPACPYRGGTAEAQPYCPSNVLEGQLSLEDL